MRPVSSHELVPKFNDRPNGLITDQGVQRGKYSLIVVANRADDNFIMSSRLIVVMVGVEEFKANPCFTSSR